MSHTCVGRKELESSVNDSFECQCDERFRPACRDLPFYGEVEGERYCVLHFPGQEKNADERFREALVKKVVSRDLDFSGVYFPGTTFGGIEFEGNVDFSWATFSGEVNFTGTTFSERAVFSDRDAS